MNLITNIEPLRNLINLEVLNFSLNLIADIEPLRNLTKLEDLCTRQNNITDMLVINNLTNLKYLGANSDPSDIGFVLNTNDLSDVKKCIEDQIRNKSGKSAYK